MKDKNLMGLLNYNDTPVQEILDARLERAGVRLFVKREDLNHPVVSGNKWWKLKYNLLEARRLGKDMLLTFGGAFSNHIYATAGAAGELGFRSVGVVRGEETLPLNHTLHFAREKGMELYYVSREDYRKKDHPDFIKTLHDRFGDFYLIPEGGTNELAVKGCEEFAQSFHHIEYDYICLPVGTGGTISGLIRGIDINKKILGFSVLKGGEFLNEEVKALAGNKAVHDHWKIMTGYHFGGYAKRTEVLDRFIKNFFEHTAIPLDFVYTAKMMWGIYDLAEKGYFRRGTTVMAIHTGGLQGLNTEPR